MSEHNGGQAQAYAALGYIVSGLLFYGVLGWLGARFLHIPLLLPLGLIVGAVLGVFMVVKRFGFDEHQQKESAWRP